MVIIMRKSLWQDYNNIDRFKSITRNMETDILIIGAGITGISTAYNLIDTKYNVILIDGHRLADSTTAKSTGKITFLQDLVYSNLNDMYGLETANLYYESQKDAIRTIKKNIKEENIDCDFIKSDSITFTNNRKEIFKLKNEQQVLDKLNINYEIITNDNIMYGIKVKGTYTFNPVKYLKGLISKIQISKNITIYEDSIINKIKKEDKYYIVYINEVKIKTNKIVLACHYPFFTIPFFIPFRTYCQKSYLSASKINNIDDINAISCDSNTISYRYYDDKTNKYLIFLNGTSNVCNKLNYYKNYKLCNECTKKITGNTISYSWTNTDVMTHDNIPFIGRISSPDRNVFIATGYNTWGMTNGTIAARIITSLINNKQNKYAKLFNPNRPVNYVKIKSFINNTLLSNIKAYTFNLIKKNVYWNKDKAIITTINKKRVGIYIDNIGNKHIVSNICPHLKCCLTFNKVDKTWDCPCHASRFDINGNVIKGPSVYNIKIKKD